MTTTSTVSTPARGKVTALRDSAVVFAPSGTNYELQLQSPGYAGSLNVLTSGVIRVRARKILTVPSGGNFVTPIFGPPRIIQGRVRAIEGGIMLVHAGVPVVVELPSEDNAFDLANGPIEIGGMVNVTAFPGAKFEPVL